MMMNEEDDLHEAPMLRSMKGQPDPFVVPQGFFDRFPHAVQEQIVKEGRSADRRILFRRAALSIGIAALLIAVWWALPFSDQQDGAQIAATIPIDVQMEELPIDEHFPWEIDPDVPLFDSVLIDLDEEELMAYLEHENVDVELLILEQ